MPFFPAMAAMKLPPCGPKIVVAGSAPKRFVKTMLLASRRFALYAQVISALVYPSIGILFKLTVTSAVSPTATFDVLTVVEIYGPEGAVLVAVGINVGVDGVDEVGVDEIGVDGVAVVGVEEVGVDGVEFVAMGVGVVDELISFKSGLNKPRFCPFFVKVVTLNNELYLNSQPANVAPTMLGRTEKCR